LKLLDICPRAAKVRVQTCQRSDDNYNDGDLPIQLACRNGASQPVIQRLYELHQSILLDPVNLSFGRGTMDVFVLHHETKDESISYLLDQIQSGKFCYSHIPILHPAKLKALADYFLQSNHLSTVKLTNSNLGVSGLVILLEAIFDNSSIINVNLSSSLVPSRFITQTIMRQLFNMGGPPPKRDEARLCTELPNPSREEFADILHQLLRLNNHIKTLDLSNNIMPLPHIWLESLIHDEILVSLNVSNCHLGDDDAEKEATFTKILVDVFTTNRTLRELYLHDNHLSENSILTILHALKEETQCSLVCLSLEGRSELVLQAAVETVSQNPRIQRLDFPSFRKERCSNRDLLLPYWRDIQYHCAMNRVVRQAFLKEKCPKKEHFVNNLIVPSQTSVKMLYGILRLEPDLWAK